MTLGDLTLPVGIQQARGLALVFTPQLAGRLAELHATYGTPNCIPIPSVMTDGRLMLYGDILTEIEPGKLLGAMWAAADKTVLMKAVEVMPLAAAVALLPAPQDP